MFDITYLNQLAVLRSAFLTNNARIKIIKQKDEVDDSAVADLEEKNDGLKEKWTEVLEQYNDTKTEKE